MAASDCQGCGASYPYCDCPPNASNVRNVNPDKPDKAPDMTHGASGQAHSSGAKGQE